MHLIIPFGNFKLYMSPVLLESSNDKEIFPNLLCSSKWLTEKNHPCLYDLGKTCKYFPGLPITRADTNFANSHSVPHK